MVYGPGGYKFTDYIKTGLPLAIILWIVATFFIPTGPDVPPPPNMKRMKTQGCIADGLLNGYGDDTKRSIKGDKRYDAYPAMYAGSSSRSMTISR